MSGSNNPYIPGNPIINSGSLQKIQHTRAIYVTISGTLAVGALNGTIINYGSVAAGTLLPFAITQVGAANTCTIVPLR